MTHNIIMLGYSWKGANVLKSFAGLVMVESYIQYYDILWSTIIVLYVSTSIVFDNELCLLHEYK